MDAKFFGQQSNLDYLKIMMLELLVLSQLLAPEIRNLRDLRCLLRYCALIGTFWAVDGIGLYLHAEWVWKY